MSQRHLSFIESGRAAPVTRNGAASRRSARRAPCASATPCCSRRASRRCFATVRSIDPALAPALATSSGCCKAHEPYPALTLDRHWNRVSANAGVAPMIAAVDPGTVEAAGQCDPPQPASARARAADRQLEAMARASARPAQAPIPHHARPRARQAAWRRFRAIPRSSARPRNGRPRSDDIAAPLRLRTQRGVLNLLSTVTVFGTALDIGLSEISLEAFYPLDEATAAVLREMARPAWT